MERWSIASASVCLWMLVAVPNASAESVQSTSVESTSERPLSVDNRRKKRGKLKIAQPIISGFCNKSQVNKVVRRSKNRLLACYTRQLMQKPNLAGKVNTQWTIGPNGRAGAVRASGLGAVGGCVAGTIRRMTFPKPAGGICAVKLPLLFR